jgi:transposase InsO family protein
MELDATNAGATRPIAIDTSPAQRRGDADQRPHREAERQARRGIAAIGRRLCDLGWLWSEVADRLRVRGRTLRRWCHDLLHAVLPLASLGRPRLRSSREERNDVLHLLDEFGPGLGVPALCDCFPNMARAELEDLLARYRRVWRERHRVPLRVLAWPVPGRVWAIDFTESPWPIEGRFRHLLAVRDLASGMQLLGQPVEAATGDEAAQALAGLFATHGAPLVLKSDNGSHFTCEAVQDLLVAHQVACLFSPPHWPRYNGGIEAGIHALKDRVAARAARSGHDVWTWDDVAGARWEANTFAGAPGESGACPADVWAVRTAIGEAERIAFTDAVSRHRSDEKCRLSSCGEPVCEVQSECVVARSAIRLALEECGYLQYRRRRILPPIPRPKAASIP